MSENEIAGQVVDAAFKIHKTLGPGLLESVYEEILAFELRKRELKLERQVAVPVVYESVRLEIGFRIDVLVEDKLIIEFKSVEKILDVHKSQLLTYLKLTGKRLGLLINFNEKLIKSGMSRVANGMPD